MKQDIKEVIEGIIRKPDIHEKDIIYQLEQLLYDTKLHNIVEKESRSITDLVSESLKQLNGTTLTNIIKSGYEDFDDVFGGFGLGEYVVIGGRPGMGKTQLLVNLALNISVESPILYFTFDINDSMLTYRFISSISGIAINDLLLYQLSDEQKEKLALVEKEFTKHQIFIKDSYNNSISAFKAHCQKMIDEKGVKVIFVDYLQMMSSNKYHKNREIEISHISRELKSIAKEYNICVIATSQLSRAVESRGGEKIPMLSDLRESGAIEQDADKVIFIYRPEYYGYECDDEGNSSAGFTELIIAKNRNGRLGVVKLLSDASFTKYRKFVSSKNEFSFSADRLDEISDRNSTLKNLFDKNDLDRDMPPF